MNLKILKGAVQKMGKIIIRFKLAVIKDEVP